METYYNPEDLPKFSDIGKEAPDLAKKIFDYYNQCKDPIHVGI